jgi:hypothetical protein
MNGNLKNKAITNLTTAKDEKKNTENILKASSTLEMEV